MLEATRLSRVIELSDGHAAVSATFYGTVGVSAGARSQARSAKIVIGLGAALLTFTDWPVQNLLRGALPSDVVAGGIAGLWLVWLRLPRMSGSTLPEGTAPSKSLLPVAVRCSSQRGRILILPHVPDHTTSTSPTPVVHPKVIALMQYRPLFRNFPHIPRPSWATARTIA